MIPLVENMLSNVIDLATGILDNCKKKNKNVWGIHSTYPIGVETGKTYNIQDYIIYKLKYYTGTHSVQSIGYGFSIINNKLKDEYKYKLKNEIIELKKNNVDITEQQIIPQLAFYGDTSIKAFTDHDKWKKYPIIITECTIFTDKPSDIQYEHTHWNQIKEIIKNNQSNYFVLIHTSMSVTNDYLINLENNESFKNFIFFK